MHTTPFDDRDGFIWMDGQFVLWREAKIHVLTHGLHYASAVFEGIRVYDGKIFKLREHCQRLLNSARHLGFSVPYSLETLEAATKETIAKLNIQNGYIRPIAWRGSEMLAIAARASKIHVAISAWSWPDYFSSQSRERGLRLQISNWARPAPNTAPTMSKAAALYSICTLAKHAAEEAGFDDALLLDHRGFIAEATGANIFLVINSQLHTPLPDCFLDGITRQTIMELAKGRGIEVIERHINPEELKGATEVFLTGTAVEVAPVRQIDKYAFTDQSLTVKLMRDFSARVKQPS
jgi:branched-chain amino acid aminotransferase